MVSVKRLTNIGHLPWKEKLNLKSIQKTRYKILFKQRTWEIDLFNNGITLAEIELPNIREELPQPPFIREEVTGNYQFSNEYIANHLLGGI